MDNGDSLAAELERVSHQKLNQSVKDVCHWLCQCYLESELTVVFALAEPVAHEKKNCLGIV
jgi:hypothetical protein